MKLSLSFLFACLLSVLGHTQVVQHIGMAKSVMTGKDLSSNVGLDSLLREPHLFGVGPYNNLQGEITIIDGLPLISTIKDGKISTYLDPNASAPFLAFSYQKDWVPYHVNSSIQSLHDLQNLVDSLGRQHGIKKEEAFPFKLSGQWDSLAFHVIMRDTNEMNHSHEAHKKAKVNFYESNCHGDLVGFFSRHHEGVFTHKNQYIHVHFASADRSRSGHLDDIKRDGHFTVYLPSVTLPSPILVNDTDFSKGRLGFKQLIGLDDLVKLHGHLCDGLVVGYLGLQSALYALYPDSTIDRTNTRIVSKSSPCLADAALMMTGGRYQYDTYYIEDEMPYLFVVQRIDNELAFGVKLKPNIKPKKIDKLGAMAVNKALTPCEIDELRRLEDDFTNFLLHSDPQDVFTVESIENFNWSPSLSNNFIKTDILNKDAKRCSQH